MDIDQHSGAGYKLRDGSYKFGLEVFRNDSLLLASEGEYLIKNSQRVMKNVIDSECKEILLIGGSHNFGQSLNDEETLQFALNSNGFSTLNISTPGYGLVNNLAIINEQKLKDDKLWKCSPKFIIYRFINDHINRDNLKTGLSPYGSYIKMESDIPTLERSDITTVAGLLHMLALYMPTRLLWYASNKESELFVKLLGRQLQRWWHFTEDDIKRSAYMLGSLPSFWDEVHDKPIVIVLIDGFKGNVVTEKYINFLQNFQNIEVILPSDSKKFESWAKINCLELRLRTPTIPYEGHPTGCLNKFYSKKVLKQLMTNRLE
ncbi:MAG: hypothetical protein ACJZ8U_01075 [Paracoccaceae bacterium]